MRRYRIRLALLALGVVLGYGSFLGLAGPRDGGHVSCPLR